ncbi:MAG: murein biosynthesis integral membrane protein MurJ [Candidatus Aquicultor sp.]|nr:murein biosynthesis integral membrane protein MurJ [Candidatus Aquicultor sp.]
MRNGEYVAATEELKPPSIARSTAKMSIATIFSRGTGFIKTMVLAYAIGIGPIADAFNTANVMPNIIFELVVGGILGSVIIPVYVQYLSDKSDEESRYMISNLTNIIFVLGIVLSLFSFLFAPAIVQLMTMHDPSKATPLMIFFFRVFSLKIMFYALAAVFTGALNSQRRFTIPMAAPIFNNLVVIVTVLGLYVPFSESNPDFALTALAIGTMMGVVVMALVQIPSVLKLGLRPRLTFDWHHPAVKQVARLGLPMLGFAATTQINTFIIYSLLQPFDKGPTAYAYALAFFQLPYAIFIVSITTAIFPELSRYANSKDFTSFKKTLSLGVRATSFITIPSAMFVGIMAKPIIGLTLERGEFGEAGTAITAAVLTSFAFALLSFSLYNMLTRVYYSLQDTKTPLKIGAVSVPLQILFNFLFIGIMGVSGLPLAYALALTFAVVAQLYVLRRKIGPIGASHMLRAMGKQVMAAIPAGGAMYLVPSWVGSLELPRMLGLATEIGGAAVLGLAVYLGLALLFRVEEVDFIKKLLRRFKGAKATSI